MRELGDGGSSTGGGEGQARAVVQELPDGVESRTMERKKRVKGALQYIKASSVLVHQANLHRQITQCHNGA